MAYFDSHGLSDRQVEKVGEIMENLIDLSDPAVGELFDNAMDLAFDFGLHHRCNENCEG